MLDIFLTPYKTNNKLTNVQLERYLDIYRYVITEVNEYYKNENYYVKRPNMFVSILNNMEVGYTLDKNDVLEYLEYNINYISRNYDIASDGNTGNVLSGNILHGCNEIYILTRLYDPFEINENNYDSIKSIKCIYNTDNVLNISHPYRIKHLTGSDIAVFELDLTALGLQYYYWSKDQIKNDRDTDIARFVYALPINNVIWSYTNITLFNVFTELWNGEEISETIRYNPIVTMDPTKNVINEYKKLINNLKRNKRVLYVDLLDSIPLLYDSALEGLRIDKLYYTLQDRWVLWLSRLEYINWLLDSLGDIGIKRNEKYVKELLVDIKNDERSGVFKKVPSNLIVNTYFNIWLSDIKTKINYNW